MKGKVLVALVIPILQPAKPVRLLRIHVILQARRQWLPFLLHLPHCRQTLCRPTLQVRVRVWALGYARCFMLFKRVNSIMRYVKRRH